MSYDEHLISQAGGDGDILDQIEAHRKSMERAHRMSCSDPADPERNTTYGESAKAIAYLLALVREQSRKLEAVGKLADRWATHADGREYYAKRVRHVLKVTK